MMYAEQIDRALKLLNHKERNAVLDEKSIDLLRKEIESIDAQIDKEIYLCTEAGPAYLYLLFGKPEENPDHAYRLGVDYIYSYMFTENRAPVVKIIEIALDCLVYAYKHGNEDAFYHLMQCLLFLSNYELRFYTGLRDSKVILKLFEVLTEIIDDCGYTNLKLLLNKRIGQYHGTIARITHDIVDRKNWKSAFELFKDYLKALKGYQFDAIEKLVNLMTWPVIQNPALRNDLHYGLCEQYKTEYRFIDPDQVCAEALYYFNLEDYCECDTVFEHLLDLNNQYVYYNYAIFLKHGFFIENKETALEYFVKAYELGMMEASYHIADLTDDREFANIAIEHNIIQGYKVLLRLEDEDTATCREEYKRKLIALYEPTQ